MTLLCLSATACSDKVNENKNENLAPVKTAKVLQQNLSHEILAVGNVAPSATVNIVPRVTGEITAVYFTEGEEVQEGQQLIEIDPRPYHAIYAEKKANLVKDKAQLDKALEDRRRFGRLVNNGYVSKEAYDQAVTDANMLKAIVEADKAALESANLDISYCVIKAPITGRVGVLNVDKGNMVKNNSSEPITKIDTLSPTYINFSIPEIHLSAIMDSMKKGKVSINAQIPDGPMEKGEIMLIDNNVDPSTGTIRLRGKFENEDRHLWPGQFVNVILPLGNYQNALTVPSQAVQPGRDGSYIFRVGKGNRAELVSVKPVFENGEYTVIEGDLNPGDEIITEGQLRLRPGMPVEIQ